MLGQLLGRRYKIVESLGVSSFGQTYIAIDVKLFNKKCVVKQLKPVTTDYETLKVAKRLFYSEAQLLHRLGIHDQIPHLLAHFQENRKFYLVQQFIEGDPLSNEFTPQTQFSEAYVIDLLQGILEPLAFVHENNVIHRDIKPSNLIRRKSDGKIVLIDFGAIKQIGTNVEDTQEKTYDTVIVGTPGYMPSEQASGQPRLSSDIYAVGLVGIQALTGLKPDQLQKDECTAEIIWDNLGDLSPRLLGVLDKMLRYDFRQRYYSASDALKAVQRLALSAPPITITEYVTQQQLVVPTLRPPEAPDHSLLPLARANKQHKFIESQIHVQPQYLITKDKTTEKRSFLPQRNYVLWYGISVGTITSLGIAVLFYIFVYSKLVGLQPTRFPSQNNSYPSMPTSTSPP
ncbi:MAG: serine/threonine-protein kinase [Rhizonema sp. NSF051]|nr:serine/threonine-protein kinase [Rhizonema sp. NSF051]